MIPSVLQCGLMSFIIGLQPEASMLNALFKRTVTFSHHGDFPIGSFLILRSSSPVFPFGPFSCSFRVCLFRYSPPTRHRDWHPREGVAMTLKQFMIFAAVARHVNVTRVTGFHRQPSVSASWPLEGCKAKHSRRATVGLY
jgi:hypothetical protein